MPFSQQSPIDLHNAIQANLGKRALELHWEGPVFGTVKQDDDGVKVDIVHQESHYVLLDETKFLLRSFHFHHPCEHWIEGRQHTMELHVVHQNPNDGSYAVVGILIEVSDKGQNHSPANDDVIQFIDQVSKILNASEHHPVSRQVSTSPVNFLPESPEEYYRYEGSLTTPQPDGVTYLEAVKWAVMRNPLYLKAADLKKLVVEFQKPARFLQTIDRRFILATFDPTKAKPPKSK